MMNQLFHSYGVLKQCQFNIHSFIPVDNRNNLPSNEDIWHALTHIGNNQMISCVNYYPESRMGYCNIYSYSFPNKMRYYFTNNFSDGLYKNVRKISLFDQDPFEHEFFIRISQCYDLPSG